MTQTRSRGGTWRAVSAAAAVAAVVVAVCTACAGSAGSVTAGGRSTPSGLNGSSLPWPPKLKVDSSSTVSGACHGGSAEPETAAQGGYVYVAWIGCGGIGFARSADGGSHFGPPVMLPASAGGWDPSIDVAADGTVYVAFMVSQHSSYHPVVERSDDHGRTFGRVSQVIPPRATSFGDRDFIAVSRAGTIYLTWDYGPRFGPLRVPCARRGSCYFTAGDLNVVSQSSSDGARTWTPISSIAPGFPANGGDIASVVAGPGGQVSVAYLGHHVGPADVLGPGEVYFTASKDGGSTWRRPVRLSTGPVPLKTWWITPDLGMDAAGNLYVVWDSRVGGHDIGWLRYSADGGRTWSHAVRITPDSNAAPHIIGVVGGAAGTAYIGWLSGHGGYSMYLRVFANGRLSAPLRVSSRPGSSAVWPGDTVGISWLGGSPSRVVLSWGGASGTAGAEIHVATVTIGARLPGLCRPGSGEVRRTFGDWSALASGGWSAGPLPVAYLGRVLAVSVGVGAGG